MKKETIESPTASLQVLVLRLFGLAVLKSVFLSSALQDAHSAVLLGFCGACFPIIITYQSWNKWHNLAITSVLGVEVRV